MTTTLIEETTGGKLTFEFSDKWQVYKYDEQSPDNFYEKIKHLGLKAVDFVAVSEKSILLFEVKYIKATNDKSSVRFYPLHSEEDIILLKAFRENMRYEEQKKIKTVLKRPYLVEEISKKARDTLAGLLMSYRYGDKKLQPYNNPQFLGEKPIFLILFLERNEEDNQPKVFKPLASNLKLAIEQKTKFLGNVKVDVMNTLTIPSALGINVFSDK